MTFRYSGTNWAGTVWRTADAITTLGGQIAAARPGSFPTDGTVASKTHDQTSPTSDHRPDGGGVVRAIDFGGPAAWLDTVAETIRISEDPRVKYVIHGGRMYSSYPTSTVLPYTWRPYTGSNPHTTHIHLSVVGDDRADSGEDWLLEGDTMTTHSHTPPPDLTGPGQVFETVWLRAVADGLATEHTDPVDVVEKQEMFAFLYRMLDLVVLPAISDLQAAIDGSDPQYVPTDVVQVGDSLLFSGVYLDTGTDTISATIDAKE